MGLFKRNLQLVLRLSIPLALTGFGQAAGFFCDTLFLARLGSNTLAAGALVGWLFSTFAVILFGTLNSISILVAHQYGAKNEHEISLIVRDGLWLALMLTIVAVLLFWNIPPLFLLLGQSPAVVLAAKLYLHALSWGFLPYFIMIALMDLMIGLGHIHVVLIFGLIDVALKILFSFLLIFGKFGLPSLGIAGAGWGMTISALITSIAFFAYLLCQNQYRQYLCYLFISTPKSYLLKLIQVGVPMGFMYFVEVGFFFVLALCVGAFGSQLLAANQIAMQYLSILMAVIFAVAQAITVRMGHLIGAGNADEAKYAAYAGTCISTVFMLVVAMGYWCFPKALISIDFDLNIAKNAELIDYAVQFLTVCALFQIFESIRISLFGALRALHDTRFTLFISIISFWGIALPLGYLLATYLRFGVTGFWWGMVLSAIVSVMLLAWRFNFKIKLMRMQSINSAIFK